MELFKNFKQDFNKIFGKTPIENVATIPGHCLRFEITNKSSFKARTKEAKVNAMEILENIFSEGDVWLQIVLWKETSLIDLKECGFNEEKFISFYETIDENKVLYLYAEKFNKIDILPFIEAVINFDMGVEPTADITCFCIDLSIPAVAHVYDDRGMNFITTNEQLLKKIELKFKDLLIQSY